MQHLFARDVRETDMAERDFTPGFLQRTRAAFVLVRMIHQRKHTFRARDGSPDGTVKLRNFVDRSGKLLGVDDERRNCADSLR